MRNKGVRAITERYLTSGGCNGFPVRDLAVTDAEQRQQLAVLIKSGKASVNFGDRHPNAHILAFAPETAEEQLQKLDSGLSWPTRPLPSQ